MHFSTTAVSALVLILSLATGSTSAAATTPCDVCLESSMIKLQPACANLPPLGDINTLTDAKMSDQHRKCICAFPADSNAWYQSCAAADKCNSLQMGQVEMLVLILKQKTVCPAAPSGGANATGGANANGSAAASGNGSSSSKMVGAAAGLTVAATAILSTLL
ncbi:hypothetical protein BGX29_005493 [Mortierella sp. GBA35]|nr:hypothetical protein BGX23_012527 [Mortierella sp. AD031]KAF9101577.1 hypothetical protein BGX29_005493 [Mortierella sp. GBA35]KAG0208336.1 hypothetical protein BGX33_006309 [Mortierella sp. NVP41]